MKKVQFKITFCLIFIGSILISVNNIFNLKNYSYQDAAFAYFVGIWIGSIIVYSFFSTIIIDYILNHITKPFADVTGSSGLHADCEKDEIKYLDEGRKKNEEKPNEQKNQVEAILLHIKDGIISFSIDGNLTYINPAAIDLLQIDKTDDSFEKIFDKINLDVNLEKIVYLDDVTSFEQMVFVGEKYINVFFAPLKDCKNIPNGILVLLQDITEHVKLDNMRKEFVADVSHELKTPITSIMGCADTLLDSEYDKEMQTKFLNVISSESVRMSKLVSDLLTLSRYDSNKNKSEKTQIDLGEMTKHCLDKLSIEIEKKKHKVECFVTADVPKVKADKYGIERVILNILTNSIKYTAEGGNIKIYVGFVYNDAYIKVIDNGIGIPEGDLPRIFERFYRVDKARARELGGTGLGLSIAKEIIEKNNGSIDIKSEFGKGTEVVIRIPVKTREIIENNKIL